ncbi:MAG: cobaltochelatase subunit CobN [Deltaproteobacteria bacterium]|nr:cobaltochelatase subunit CobN [Deltaproteobacteria bacterium]
MVPHKGRKFEKASHTYKETLHAIKDYKSGLEQSSANELNTVINFLSGGYVSPSSGGDAITNPGAIPTGRNMLSIDVEMTPTPEAWEVDVKLAKKTINKKIEKTGMFPKKIAITL